MRSSGEVRYPSSTRTVGIRVSRSSAQVLPWVRPSRHAGAGDQFALDQIGQPLADRREDSPLP